MGKRQKKETVAILVSCPNCSHTHEIVVSPSELLKRNPVEQHYKVADIQKMFGVTRQTVMSWIHDNKLYATRTGTSRTSPWYISESAIREFRQKYRSGA